MARIAVHLGHAAFWLTQKKGRGAFLHRKRAMG